MAAATTAERGLLFAKLLHFLSCLAGAAWGRYQGIYLNTHRHLSPLENGLVRGGGLLAKFLLTPLWGAWSDSGDPRSLLVLSVTSCALLFHFYRLDVTYSHFTLLLLLKVTRSGANGSGTLVDIITLRLVSGTSEGYGSQRLWTAVAWGVGSWGAGKAIDAYGFDAIWWWYYTGTAALLLLIASCPYGGGTAEGGGGGPTQPLLRRNSGGRGDSRGVDSGSSSSGVASQCPMCAGPLDTLRGFRAFVWPENHTLRGPGAVTARRRNSGGNGDAPRFGRFFAHMIVASLVMALVESILFLQMERDFHSARALMGTITLVGKQFAISKHAKPPSPLPLQMEMAIRSCFVVITAEQRQVSPYLSDLLRRSCADDVWYTICLVRVFLCGCVCVRRYYL